MEKDRCGRMSKKEIATQKVQRETKKLRYESPEVEELDQVEKFSLSVLEEEKCCWKWTRMEVS